MKDKVNMRKVLITGAGGYIGCVLVETCLSAGYEVIAVDRFFFGIDRLDRFAHLPALTLLKKDIRDIKSTDFDGVEVVFDLAALSNDPSGDLDPELTYAVNFEGRKSVATEAKYAGVSRYVLASSCSVYGAGGDRKLDENAPPNPLTTYAKANLEAEKSVLALNDKNFHVTVMRQATVFGISPRMRFDLVINIMTLNAVQKGKLYITGGGQQFRPLVHVKDTCRAFVAVSEANPNSVAGEIFNIGNSNLRVINIAYIVRETIPFPIEIEMVPDDPDKRDYLVSFDKIQRVLGFQAQIGPQEGVREIYEALKCGDVLPKPWHYTVAWYKNIIEAKRIVDDIQLNGRYL